MAYFGIHSSDWPDFLQNIFTNGAFEGPFNILTDELRLVSGDDTIIIRGSGLEASDGRTITSGTITQITVVGNDENLLSAYNFTTPPDASDVQAILSHLDGGYDAATYNGLVNDLMFFEPVVGYGSDDSNDLFRPSAFADYFNGVINSDDTIDYSWEGGPSGILVNVKLGTVTDTFGNTDTFEHVERFIGTAHDDIFKGAKVLDSEESNVFVYVGGDGKDQFNGGAGIDVVSYREETGTQGIVADLSQKMIYDTFGNKDFVKNIEMIKGSNFADNILGDSKNNIFVGNAGDDVLNGGYGKDTVDYGTEWFDNPDRSHGVIVNLSSDKLTDLDVDGIDVTTLAGNSAIDTYGDTDRLWKIENVVGTARNDFIVGDNANNKLEGGFGDDALFGNGGKDELHGGYGNDLLGGGYGDDTLYGESGNDTLTGDSGKDKLYGGDGNDVLDGGKDKDVLDGGKGADILTGGADKDVFDYNALSDSGTTVDTRDIIADFEHKKDKIDVRDIDADITSNGDQAFHFIAAEGAGFSGIAGELIWSQTDLSGTADDITMISGDVNGDGVADFEIQLTGLIDLTSSDFVL